MHLKKSTLAAAAVLPIALAQTYTDCNPTEKTCPNDTALDSSTFSCDFTEGSSAAESWTLATGTTLTYGTKGAEFVISKEGEAPTISTDFYFFFGTVEVVMQAAAGTGIVSSIVLESDDLDEIDWEFLGGDTTQAETNYFGKGNTTTYNRAIYYDVTTPQTEMHTYTVDWTSEAITYAIDGTVVRTLEYADANGGSNFPQTPMRVKLGNWCGGCSGEAAGTVEWAGGSTDMSDGPFTMYVESVKITNNNPGKEYEWTDKTGSYESIKVISSDNSSSSDSSSSAAASSSTSSASQSTVAPTSTAKVYNLAQTADAVSSTKVGSASTTAAASADTEIATSTTLSKTKTATTAKSSTTAVGTYNLTTSSNSSATTSSSFVGQTSTSGASLNTVAVTLASIMAMGMCFMVL